MIKKFNYKVIDVSNNEELKNVDVVIYGLSVTALYEYIALVSDGVNIVGFTDSYVKKSGDEFAGKPVLTMTEIGHFNNVAILVPTRNSTVLRQILYHLDKIPNLNIYGRIFVYGAGEYDIKMLSKNIERDKTEIEYVRSKLCDEMSLKTFDNLLKYRVTNETALIENVYETGHEQYFPISDILIPQDKEVFVDVGAYNGDTSLMFSSKWAGKYKKIYMMEPDNILYNVTKENVRLRNLQNYEVFDVGAWSKSGEIMFVNDTGSGSSHISDEGTTTIKTITIDEMLDDNGATFIKMDIEGAEYEALIGCQRTIMKYRPRLAISIYHKADDLWKLPYYLMKEYPWYRFYIRHYTEITTETVLYAV